jgi:hypothetical protein
LLLQTIVPHEPASIHPPTTPSLSALDTHQIVTFNDGPIHHYYTKYNCSSICNNSFKVSFDLRQASPPFVWNLEIEGYPLVNPCITHTAIHLRWLPDIMSRNARQRPPVTPVKPSKRRGSDSSSSLDDLSDLSDSDGYSAVGGISDSDEDEEDVIAAEEEHILENDSQVNPSNHGSPWPSTEEAAEEGDDEEDDDDDDVEEEDDEEEVVDHTEWEGFMSEGNEDLATDASTTTQDVVERRVRFAGVPDSDGDTTETDDGIESIFPDIFVDQSSLDPTFRREIENDNDNSSDSGSFWDLHGSLGDDLYVTDLEGLPFLFDSDSTPVATPMTGQEPSTTMSTPVASPQKDDDDMSDGYQSEFCMSV